MTHTAQAQDEVFRFLSDPATHDGAAVTRIDTHGAAVFLAGPRVYKVKRAVRFPFLDYSSVDKRKAACEAELQVNRAFAPQLYRRVVPIAKDANGRLALGGKGETLDWALEMVRFDETATLDHLADKAQIDAHLADQLGRAVATAHDAAPAVDPAPWIAALSDYIAQNHEAFREWPDLFPAQHVERLTQACTQSLARVRPLLRERGAAGLIRRGHGDLHLGNIILIDDRPVLFDAIEFDPVVASGDLLYDLAFLLMDLIARDLTGAANIVLNRYLADTARDSDLDALSALPLFMTLRAAIRAKVTAAKLAQADDDKKRGITDSAQSYFALALRLIAPPPPQMIAVGGLSGSGKSLLARMLAAHIAPLPGAVLLRSDVMRKRMFDVAETEKLPKEAYTPDVTARIYAKLSAQAVRIVNAGHSAIVDAVFAKEDERDMLAQTARDADTTFTGLFLTASLETRLRRVGGRTGDASDADAAVARQQADYDLGQMSWIEIDASGTPEETLKNALASLKLADARSDAERA
jgi:uncharacterized protein